MTSTVIRSGIAAAFAAALAALLAPAVAAAAPVQIVAIGASNTSGWGVFPGHAYPERLQALLRNKGYQVQVINAGAAFDTTAGMLGRLDSAVPAGTRIVIIQPGGNDVRFGISRQQRAVNIAAMVKRLRARKIKVIVFDPVIPQQYYLWDQIHLSSEGHAMFASRLLPQVIAAIAR